MATSFSDHWRTVLGTTPLPDVVASIREEALTEFLRVHHQVDNDRYTFKVEREFIVDGTTRKFELVVKAETPLRIDLAPFSTSAQSNWTQVEAPSGAPRLGSTVMDDPVANVRLSCDKVALTLKWPKLDGTGQWAFSPPPLRMFAEAYLALEQTAPSGGEVYQFRLRIQPLRVRLEQARLNDIVEKALKAAGDDERQAFTDLLIIAFNVVAAEYAPKLVRDFDIPVPIVAKQRIVPCTLAVRDKIVTVGGAVNLRTAAQEAMEATDRAIAAVESAMHQDIAEHGGFDKLVLREGQTEGGNPQDIKVYSADEVRKRMRRTDALLKELNTTLAGQQDGPQTAKKTLAGPTAAVSDGAALGVDEYLLDNIVRAAVPQPRSGCSDWVTLLEAVRGRACYWARVFDPDVSINGTTLSGSTSVDVGGALEACVRKFWDCSWRWECGSLSIGVAGRPQVVFFLETGAGGIAFKARINGNVKLVTNLPFPFDKVIEAFGAVIITIVEALVNLFLALVTFQIVVPEVKIQNQKTKVVFGRFVPFAFTRTTTASMLPGQGPFIAFGADVEPKG